MGIISNIKKALRSNAHPHIEGQEGDDFSMANEADLEYGNLGPTGETIEDSYRPDEGGMSPDSGTGQVL
jgi:hypothetical protein